MNQNFSNYFDEEFFAKEAFAIGKNSWFCLGHDSDFKEGFNIAKPWTFEVLLVKKVNKFDAFLNVCPHRGLSFTGDDICLEKDLVSCKYHGLQFGVDGEAVKALYKYQRESNFSLQKLNVDTCGKFIFVSFQSKVSLKEYLSEHYIMLEKYSDSIGRKVIDRQIETSVNWKLQMENFLDCLHTLWVHQDTIGNRQRLQFSKDYRYNISKNTSSIYSAGSSLSESTLNVYTRRSPNRKYTTAGYEHVHCFPNFNLATDQGFYFVNLVLLPTTFDKSILKLALYLPEGSEFSPAHIGYVETAILRILEEDMRTVRNYTQSMSYLETNFEYSGFEERTQHFVKNCLKYSSDS